MFEALMPTLVLDEPRLCAGEPRRQRHGARRPCSAATRSRRSAIRCGACRRARRHRAAATASTACACSARSAILRGAVTPHASALALAVDPRGGGREPSPTRRAVPHLRRLRLLRRRRPGERRGRTRLPGARSVDDLARRRELPEARRRAAPLRRRPDRREACCHFSPPRASSTEASRWRASPQEPHLRSIKRCVSMLRFRSRNIGEQPSRPSST